MFVILLWAKLRWVVMICEIHNSKNEEWSTLLFNEVGDILSGKIACGCQE